MVRLLDRRLNLARAVPRVYEAGGDECKEETSCDRPSDARIEMTPRSRPPALADPEEPRRGSCCAASAGPRGVLGDRVAEAACPPERSRAPAAQAPARRRARAPSVPTPAQHDGRGQTEPDRVRPRALSADPYEQRVQAAFDGARGSSAIAQRPHLPRPARRSPWLHRRIWGIQSSCERLRFGRLREMRRVLRASVRLGRSDHSPGRLRRSAQHLCSISCSL